MKSNIKYVVFYKLQYKSYFVLIFDAIIRAKCLPQDNCPHSFSISRVKCPIMQCGRTKYPGDYANRKPV